MARNAMEKEARLSLRSADALMARGVANNSKFECELAAKERREALALLIEAKRGSSLKTSIKSAPGQRRKKKTKKTKGWTSAWTPGNSSEERAAPPVIGHGSLKAQLEALNRPSSKRRGGKKSGKKGRKQK